MLHFLRFPQTYGDLIVLGFKIIIAITAWTIFQECLTAGYNVLKGFLMEIFVYLKKFIRSQMQKHFKIKQPAQKEIIQPHKGVLLTQIDLSDFARKISFNANIVYSMEVTKGKKWEKRWEHAWLDSTMEGYKVFDIPIMKKERRDIKVLYSGVLMDFLDIRFYAWKELNPLLLKQLEELEVIPLSTAESYLSNFKFLQ